MSETVVVIREVGERDLTVTYTASFSRHQDCDHDSQPDRTFWGLDDFTALDENSQDIAGQIKPDDLEWLEAQARQKLEDKL